jgi:hypothetical protein
VRVRAWMRAGGHACVRTYAFMGGVPHVDVKCACVRICAD